LAALSVVIEFVMLFILFCAGFAHDDCPLWSGESARQFATIVPASTLGETGYILPSLR